jgi:uncharacterized membrane protein YgcG
MSNNKIAIAMKSNYFQKKLSIYSILGMIALLATSCGSYQSTSYYDRDGIYGGNDKSNAQTEPTTRKDYFSAYKTDENTAIFTDVDNYSTTYAETPSAVAQEESAKNYGGWGDNTENVTVNVYGGNWPYWGWNNYWYGSYWGWNSWIGPSWSIGWGWGYPYYGYYGWGYPYYGWGGNYCYSGYHNHYSNHSYAYNSGRRNYSYNGSRTRNYSTPGTRSYSTGTRANSYTTTGTRNYSAPRSSSSPTRSEASAPRQNNNTYSAPRSSSPTRSYTPSSGGGTRSYGGGGGSYGGGGGGGSRGGGRR